MSIISKQNRLSPLLKYPGGKEKELNYILPNLPSNAKNFYEPFVGGGAVYFSLEAERYFINDKSDELIDLYRLINDENSEFLDKIKAINHNWQVIENVLLNHSDEISNIYYQYKKEQISRQ